MFFFFISPFGMGQVRNGDANNLNLLVVGAMVVTFLLSALLSEATHILLTVTDPTSIGTLVRVLLIEFRIQR